MGRTTYFGGRRWRNYLGAIATLAVIVLGLGGAASATTALPEGLDVPALALTPADFDGGARVAAQGFVAASAPEVAAYERIFHPGARLARKRLLYAESFVSIYVDDSSAAASLASTRSLLSTSSGRRALAKAIVGAARLKGLSFTVARPVTLRLGQDAFRMSIVGRVRTQLGTIRLEMALAVVRIDRAIGIVTLIGTPATHLTGSPPLAAATKLAQHFQHGFTIRNLVLPVLTGSAQQGQTLTADSGHWAGAPSLFTYQWNRCDPAGANCTPIPAATAQTYLLGTQDSSKRITITVKATNSMSTASAISAATTLVP